MENIVPLPSTDPAVQTAHPKASLTTLTLGALGVVFGDIGTSPLYTLRECLRATEHGHASPADVLGLLSLIFWSLTMVVTVKYLSFILRADNDGEGGIFALLALVPRRLRVAEGGKRISGVALLVVIGAALLYGDGAITPAISVLSALEGLSIVSPHLESAIVPLACGILFVLFFVQKRGTGTVGNWFGPIMVVWFLTIGVLGAYHIVRYPGVLAALSPHHALRYFTVHGLSGFLVLGAVVLAITGGEALYADMGHFGVRPIRLAWLGLAMPALVLCYFGQGALVLAEPNAIANPFFAMVPAGFATLLLVLLSSAATIIASQALISGAFSLTRQAMQLGYFPRVTIEHTAAHTEGQIYIPQINWILALGCLLLVIGFRRSEHLAAAYGIAVTGTMALTSIVYYVVVRHTWKWSALAAAVVVGSFLIFDLSFFLANSVKLVEGGWVPVVIGMGFVAAMLIWSKGRSLIVEEYARRCGTLVAALPRVERQLYARVPGIAVFMASSTAHVPPILIHLVERTQTLAENVFLLTVTTESAPTIAPQHRMEITPLQNGFRQIVARYGFMEQPDVPAIVLAAAEQGGLSVDLQRVTYFLGRERVLGHETGRMGRWVEGFFGYLQRNAVAADRHFQIPPAQVVELGIQLDL